MTEGGNDRLVAWSRELRVVHGRLREALQVTQEALATGDSAPEMARELLLYCHGFCTALTTHHEGEDRRLFPVLADEHPELAPTLRALEQDHAMIAHLIGSLRGALDSAAPPAELARHLEGIAAIMESHFRYEERVLLPQLESLTLDADPGEVLGYL